MIKNKEQRVGVLVDVSNMYHSAKQSFSKKANFKEILAKAVSGRKLIRAIAYAIKTESGEEIPFFEALNGQGFEIKMKDLQIFHGGAKKADWDVGIAVDAVKLSDKLDVIVIVSGDGDFIPLVEYLQNSKGCLVEIMGFKQNTSSELIAQADDYTDLSSSKKFVI